uniref:Dolichyl-diphosphooligosaccharide--protein glycosyltransferase subunit DAD1 n=2 Tax=Physcomitrium patens TaxID=3218 RepID=A0A7I4FC91_PHYPA
MFELRLNRPSSVQFSGAMASTAKDAQDLFSAMRSAYSKTPTRLKIIDVYVIYGLITALIQVVYMAMVGTFPFNAFLSGVLSCIGTSVLGGIFLNLLSE